MTAEIMPFPGCPKPVEPPREPGLIEPGMAPEFFCGTLARIYVHGPFTRFVWAVEEQPLEDPGANVQHVVNVKVILPTVALRAVYDAIGKRLAEIEAPTSD